MEGIYNELKKMFYVLIRYCTTTYGRFRGFFWKAARIGKTYFLPCW